MSKTHKAKPLEVLRNYKVIVREVKEIIKEIDPEVQVYVFGSVVKGEYTTVSDIDVLVVTKKIDMKYDIMVNVYKRIDAPIELHVTSPEQFKRWYKKFLKPGEIEEL